MSFEVWRKHMVKLREARRVRNMRRKKPSKRRDMVFTFSGEKGTVYIHSNGHFQITGDIKSAAFAYAKHILNDYSEHIDFNIINKYIRISCENNKNYAINWIINPEIGIPRDWTEFKEEFERVCKLKVFS